MQIIIDVVFEEVPKESIESLTLHFSSMADFAYVEEVKDYEEVRNRIEIFLCDPNLSIVAIRFTDLETEGLVIKDSMIVVYKYGSRFDVEFSFDAKHAEMLDSRSINLFHKKMIDLCEKYKSKKMFAGIEPAIDSETRFFTNEYAGPLNLENFIPIKSAN